MGLQGPAKILWKKDVGEGYSSPSISGGRLFIMGLKGSELTVTCLDAASGREIWKRSLQSAWFPESTPAIDGERLYCLNQNGRLLCLLTSNGKTVWEADLAGGLGAQRPARGWAGSPVIEGNLLLLNANSKQIALDKMTGKLRWQFEDTVPPASEGSYTAPVVADIDGVRHVFFLGPSNLIVVDASSGKQAWSYPHGDYVLSGADVVVSAKEAFVTHPGECALLRISRTEATAAWRSTDLTTWLPAPVLLNGFLYGTYIPPGLWITSWTGLDAASEFRCLDWKTGKVMWGNQEIASTSVLADTKGPRTYAVPPVLCDGRLYCRNCVGDLTCIDVR